MLSLIKLKKMDLDPNPFKQFEQWMNDAILNKDIELPEACCLSTVDTDGYPEGRIMLLKGVDDDGFIFFTNKKSAKGKSLMKTPKAALTFHWKPITRQIRIQGDVIELGAKQAQEYFDQRPRLSQIGARVSKQSQTLKSKLTLIEAFYRERMHSKDKIERPEYWVGFKVIPRYIEFWEDCDYRMHDRFVYRKNDTKQWNIDRFYP